MVSLDSIQIPLLLTFRKPEFQAREGAEAVYWQLWLPQHSVGEQPGEQVGTNVQMPLLVALRILATIW